MRVTDALHAHEWVPGAKAAFEKFADYVPRQEPGSWLAGGKRILVDRIEWNVMPDAATAAAVAADGAPIREMADLGDDAAPPMISEEQADAAEFEVTPEDGADPLGLFLGKATLMTKDFPARFGAIPSGTYPGPRSRA